MKKSVFFTSLLIILLSLLSACTGPKTPQEVTQAFWQAVLTNKVEKVIRYSTITSPAEYDKFSQDWNNLQPSWGKVIIENDQASVVTRFSNPARKDDPELKFVTYLIKQQGVWKVDYASTHQAITASSSIINFFSKLNQLGQNFSRQLESATSELVIKLENMATQLEELSASLDEQATQSIKQHSERLRNYMDELARSLERALKEHENSISDDDRQKLNKSINDLDTNRDNLSEPSIHSVSESSRSISSTWQYIETLDDETFRSYKQQWRTWGEQIETDLQHLLEQLTSSASSK